MEINMDNSLIGTLGIEMKEYGDGKIIATMPVDERTRQPYGLLHGEHLLHLPNPLQVPGNAACGSDETGCGRT